MADIVPPKKRSQMMAGIRSRNTGPEIAVRKWLHANGYRFRLHRKDLPGTPDIILPKHNLAIFVHGCFWHQHKDCKLAKLPATRTESWMAKFSKNTERDRIAENALQALGWKTLVIWECEIRKNTFPDIINAALKP